ncbi:hypothetical protein B0H66DRAFT_557973 [Apodospora peruviana]|uniref:Uncharacterized protein n=1 Tax=Apodospora peruviana TaxID=516989 RepID=A0AAE0I4Z1_9PEZI|nr:hypothetical protein B0H66DRAFT_557973 [Apodospora peruviana]
MCVAYGVYLVTLAVRRRTLVMLGCPCFSARKTQSQVTNRPDGRGQDHAGRKILPVSRRVVRSIRQVVQAGG